MGDNNGLSQPGFSVYDSNTMSVGDGTWDSERNSFLLPNLVGLNFETMRYNGMGNRFRDLPQYHRLILGHGVVAAITFLGLIPLSIFVSKWGKRWPGPRKSFKLHVYVQVLAIFLVTTVIALGFLAVGPERSLSNPHHGIGLAIYVLYIFLFLQGWLMYRHERKRSTFPTKLPFFVWLHNILGRAIAVLAVVQIALGLTLYGAPKVLFILYALWVAFMLFAYLALNYASLPDHAARPEGGHSEYASDYGSYLSGSRTSYAPPRRQKKESHKARNALAAVGLLGAYKWYKGRGDKERVDEEESYTERYDDRYSGRPPPSSAGPPPSQQPPALGPPAPYGAQQPPYPPSQAGYGPPPPGPGYGPPPPGPGYGPPPPAAAMRSGSRRRPSQSRLSAESWEDEKYSDRPEDHTWRNRILGGIGAFGAYQGVKSLFNRRKRDEDGYVEDRRYGNRPMEQNSVSRTDVSRVEAGEAPMSPDTPRVNMGGVQPMTPTATPSRPPRRPHPGASSISYDSRASYDGPSGRPMDDGDYTLRESVGMMGPVAGFREWNRRRKERRENQRLENYRRQELDNEEQYNRRNSMNYPQPQHSNTRRPEESGTLLSGPMTADPGSGVGAPDTSHPPLPANAGSYAPPASTMTESRQNVTTEQGYSLPPPPPGPPPQGVRADGYGPSTQEFGSAQMPHGAVNPDPARLVAENTAANESSAYGRDFSTPAAAAAGLGTGIAAATAAEHMRNDDVASPTRSSRQGSRTRFAARPEVQGSTASASFSQLNSGASAAPTAGAPATLGGNTTTTGTSSTPQEPSAAVRVKMHQDGRHATLRLLPEEEAAAERAARRQERRARRRRNSSFSSGGDDEGAAAAAAAGQRYRRSGRRPSQSQPITNVPPPPASSASWRRNSELNLPPGQQQQQQATPGAPPAVPVHSSSPAAAASQNTISPPAVNESIGSPGPYGTDATGTDVSAFDSNRRRRRAERARREAQLAGGGRVGNRVEFE